MTDDDLVFLDAGTTTLHMVEYLGASRATFVTNGVACARRLVEKGLRAYVLGGLLKPRTEAVVGGVALEMMANYNFTKAFLGANGISIERGYTTPDTEEACIKGKRPYSAPLPAMCWRMPLNSARRQPSRCARWKRRASSPTACRTKATAGIP